MENTFEVDDRVRIIKDGEHYADGVVTRLVGPGICVVRFNGSTSYVATFYLRKVPALQQLAEQAETN
jgi:hypothetical protein